MSSKILFEGSFPCEFGFMRGAGSEENLCAFLWDLQPELRADLLELGDILGTAQVIVGSVWACPVRIVGVFLNAAAEDIGLEVQAE